MESNNQKGYFGINADWLSRVQPPNPEYLIAFNNGDCLIEYWAPKAEDTQEPHDRDEVYLIVSGTADFSMDGQVRKVGQGDLIFVPAGMAHQFKSFSENLAMWIVFFGSRDQRYQPTP